jgi:hypothetical protein
MESAVNRALQVWVPGGGSDTAELDRMMQGLLSEYQFWGGAGVDSTVA